ncbi:hypothetical protein PanWU01x14_090350 [Parasponia andersonii]|uniref:Uncharacterized protein n=1 Tax=Parasponia andersonii TaxID=3476 RepID=A0A2P5D7P0_PARAD|nr:hypothetical protein PanWU01x14_090350 [Parasponia andersonii]
MGVEPKRVADLLAMKPPELSRHELEILGDQGEGLDLADRLDGPRRRWEDHAGARVQRPRQQLLAAELGRTDPARVEEPSPATVRGGRVQVAADDEEHLVDGVPFPD